MTVVKTKNLSGESLDWAVEYARTIQKVLAARTAVRPVKTDHAEVALLMLEIAKIPTLDPGELFAIAAQERIASFEDSGKWYALPSDEIVAWRRDLDGDEAQAMIFKEDVIQGETPEIAIKRCYVSIVLGESVEIP
jgi:hypothetical protein